ncbi:unnamed protein product [Rhodiola kirilowii]
MKTIVGTVVSNMMQKSIVIAVEPALPPPAVQPLRQANQQVHGAR